MGKAVGVRNMADAAPGLWFLLLDARLGGRAVHSQNSWYEFKTTYCLEQSLSDWSKLIEAVSSRRGSCEVLKLEEAVSASSH